MGSEMEEKPPLYFGKCIEWKTRIPFPSTSHRSPEFRILGSKWHLELLVPWGGNYKVSLCQKNYKDLDKSYYVSIYIKHDDGLILRRTSLIKAGNWIIASYPLKDIKNKFPTILNSGEIVIVCVFDLPASEASLKKKTLDVTTKTDFNHPLPVKYLCNDKLPSDEREPAVSCLSSNLVSLSHDLDKLLQDKVLPDINLRCGDRTVAAHKAVLAARSEVFSAMFQSKMLECETGVVDITDVDVQILDLFLKYVYSGKLFDVSDDALPSLYAAGDKYAVSALKSACSGRLICNLTQENCLNFLLLADAHSDRDFKNAVLDFILNHVEILKSQEWTRFNIKNPTLSIEVFQAVVQKKVF